MKNRLLILILTSAALLIWTSGCNKQPDSPTVDQTTSATGDLAKASSDLSTAGSAKAQELIDSASKLVGEGKFQDALAKLNAIGTEKLSASQQSMVDALKLQIDKAMGAASKAGAAASDLLKK